jgi:release factor glutamine methyltransferase
MKISSALIKARSKLNSSGVENSKLDSLILLSHAISASKEHLIFNPDLELNPSQQKSFFELIERRSKREPVSHLIQKREFFGEDFLVNCNVLDPRPDSESLIELVLKNFPDKNQKLKFLEIGTGSGCLIISLLKLYKSAEAFGVDISKDALEICQKNSEIHQVENRLTLKNSDLFSEISPKEKFDLIISNPPYIPSEDIKSLEPEVRIYEPIIALDGGIDGLDFYRKISSQAPNFLAKNGKIIFEIGFAQEVEVIKICSQNSLEFLGQNLDLSGTVRSLCFMQK